MKVFRLIFAMNGKPVAPLLFLDRNDATAYHKIFLWPWQTLGFYQTNEGEKIDLKLLQFRAETMTFSGIFDADLDWMLWKVEGVLGFVPLVPGRCFNPGVWRHISEQDLRDPVMAPKIAHAERELETAVF